VKKIMTLVIGVSLLFPSGALLAKERQGVQLEITKTDGTKIYGELIGIKQYSTLLLPAGSIDVSEVKIIKIVKGSNAEVGFLGGLLIGGLTGVAIGSSPSNLHPLGEILGGALGGLGGGLVGLVIGSSTHNYETFQIEGKSQEEIKAVLEKLRFQARFLRYQ
jgi:outer membrane lipoprotein SlyB